MMKATIKILLLALSMCFGAGATLQQASAQAPSVSFQVFYDELSPYGNWMNSPDYGYVWVPDVAPGFTPYATNGYWIYTDMGWTWVSNYAWGWAPFHYGRWYTDPNYGSVWVPDNEWGPGWVTWRQSGSYYGWAPIGPGVSISMAYSSNYYVPHNQWTFVSDGYLGRTNINNYYVNVTNNQVIINNSRVINNTKMDQVRRVTYNAGPERADVERYSGRTITPVRIRESGKPGQNVNNNQLEIYRPQVQKQVVAGPRPAPAKVVSVKDGKPPMHSAQPANQKQAQPQHSTQPANQKQGQPKQSAQPNKEKDKEPGDGKK